MLPAFTPSNMANGHTALKIHLTVNYDTFPKVAEQLLTDLDATAVNKINGPDVLLWKVQIKGQSIDLVFDEISGDFTLESDNKQSDYILQNLMHASDNSPADSDDFSTRLIQKSPSFLDKKFLLASLARLLVLLGIILLALKSFWVNFIPSIQYGILSLVIAAPASWLIFRYLLKPLTTPFNDLFPKYSFSWKDLKQSSNEGGALFSGLIYKVMRALVYLLRFKGFYIGIAYLFSYLTICFSVPVLLNDTIGESFSNTSRLSAKSTSRSLYCRYHLKIEDYGNVFSTGICVPRSTYFYIEPRDSVKVSGTQSWVGTYIRDVFRSGSSGY